jgi:uncharacterized protein
MYLLKKPALLAIRTYQQFISPYKGFCCAYKAHTGRESCSQLGYRAIQLYGMFHGLRVLDRRLYLCGIVSRRTSPVYKRKHRNQRGDCDPGCSGGCDLPNDGSCASPLDALQCLNCGGGSDKSKKKNKGEDEAKVYIPPYSRRNATNNL